MGERLANWIFDWLKVPITPPSASGNSQQLRVLRPSDRQYYYRFVVWVSTQLLALLSILIVFQLDWFLENANILGIFTFWELGVQLESMFLEWFSVPRWVWLSFGALIFIVEATISFLPLWLRLSHRATWYVVDENGLYMRLGVLSVREVQTQFSNIQLLTLKQNWWQWLLGLSDVEARLAGGGKKDDDLGRSQPNRVINFENIEDGPTVRDLILAGMYEAAADGERHGAVEENPLPEGEGVLKAVDQFLEEVRAWRREGASS